MEREEARKVAILIVIATMFGGILIGQVVANALDVSGVGRILVCSATILLLCWAVLGLLLLRLHRRRKTTAVHTQRT